MKATPSVVLSLIAVSVLVVAAQNPSSAGVKSSPLVGTWELMSEKWNDATEFTSPPAERKHLKFITPTHWIWVWVDPDKKISNSMGGTYTHEGDSYIETVQFAFPGMEAYVGKDQKFVAKLTGDTWNHSGVLSEGQKLEEIWKRVK
jgi:hypothetical protein